MKFCPYCGASLPGSAASFCSECGKELPQRKQTVSKKPRKPMHKAPPHQAPRQPPKNSITANYDGYYNEVQPVDAGIRGEGMDPELVKRIVLVILGTVAVIALAAVLMMLL